MSNMLKAISAVLLAFVYSSISNAVTIESMSNTLLEVKYTQGEIVKGPLSFGLLALPTEVNARFELVPPSMPPPPANPVPIPYPNFFRDIDEVLMATISFGNTTWTLQNLTNFEMNTDAAGVLEILTYRFEIDGGGIALNFPLSISGFEDDEEFEYVYNASTYTLTQVPEPTTVAFVILSLVCLKLSRRERRVRPKVSQIT